MRIVKTIGLLAFFASVSCSGGSAIDPVNVPAPATITGTVEIIGAPLATLDDLTQLGDQDASKWSLKLIDPVEDVDSILIPVLDTTFGPVEVTTAGEYLLSINLQPAVDLSGGTAATTPVTVNIPVTVETGQTTQVFATIELIAPMIASSVHTSSQISGGRLRLRYTVETRALRDTGFLEMDWNNRQLRHDTNRDEQFDDEEYFADSDRDGISDGSRDQMHDRIIMPERFTIEGKLLEFDRPQHRILVGDRWYRVTELTQVWRHTRRVHLSDLRVGQLLSINGHNGREGLKYAVEIRIMGPTDMPPGDA